MFKNHDTTPLTNYFLCFLKICFFVFFLSEKYSKNIYIKIYVTLFFLYFTISFEYKILVFIYLCFCYFIYFFCVLRGDSSLSLLKLFLIKIEIFYKNKLINRYVFKRKLHAILFPFFGNIFLILNAFFKPLFLIILS